MKPVLESDYRKVPEWEVAYRETTTPWETGKPSGELVRIVEGKILKPSRVLEVGCGTGANAVYLARRGFEVTAIDSSPPAVERARTRAEQTGALLRIVLGDVFEFAETSGPFDLVFDAGFYHFIRRITLSRFLDLLWRVTSPGSLYLTLAGAAEGAAEGEGPPCVSEDEVRSELGRLFECIELRIESPNRKDGYAGWSCLMRRPVVTKSAK